jgi:RecA-family ATPase
MLADQNEIGKFAGALFRYADVGSFVALRAYDDGGGQVFSTAEHRLTDDPTALVRAAATIVNRAGHQARRVVFCPPIATFQGEKADEASLVNGLALSVECDKLPAAARIKLEALLGPATVVVASGGEWLDPATGELHDKLHLHWRLNEPTREAAEHALLKEARALAAMLVDGDNSNKPVVHPIRWPGSWHRKGKPRLARIEALQAHRELDLQTALERLKDATEAAGLGIKSATGGTAADTSGEARHTAELVRQVLTGDDYHTPLATLAMRYLKGGMADAQAVLTLRGIMQAVPDEQRDMKGGGVQPGRWQARYDDIPRAVTTARGRLGTPAAPDVAPDDMADLVNPAMLQGIEPPVREWVVDGWLPVGTVTSLYGGAGFGKTLLAQQLQTATAIGAEFLGLQTAQCKSLAFYCEDDPDELHRRQRGICWHYGTQMQDLDAMRWQARAGKQNVMVTVKDGLMKFSDFADFVCKAVEATGAKLVILDNIAQLFGGNENVRPEVTQFVNALSAIALQHNAAVLLLGHPGKATDSQFSGSTAWDAAVRSRWLLERVKPEGDDGAAELADLRVLRKAKANYAGTGDEIPLRWVQGAFRVEGAASVQQVIDLAERNSTRNADDDAFLACLDDLTEQGRHVSASNKAQNYAPKMMRGKPAAAGISSKRLDAAMERLFNAGVIVVGPFGRDKFRREVSGLVRKPSEASAAGCSDECSTVAAEIEPCSGDSAAGCSTVRAECSTDTCNPLILLQHDDAANMQQSAAQIGLTH